MPAAFTSTSTLPKRARTAAPSDHLVWHADVARKRPDSTLGLRTGECHRLGKWLRPPADERDLPPFGSELDRDGSADTTACTSYDGGGHERIARSRVARQESSGI